jgi:hypothetical protein
MAKANQTKEFDERIENEDVFDVAEVREVPNHVVTRGGARSGAGRKARVGWIKVAFKMKAETAELLKSASAKTGKSQSDLADSILERRLKSIMAEPKAASSRPSKASLKYRNRSA